MVAGDEDTPWLSVVGVTGDVIHQWIMRRNEPTFYRPLAQAPTQNLTFALRTSGDPEALAPAVKRALAAVDPDQPAYSCRACLARSGRPRSACSTSPGSWRRFGVLALVLAVAASTG